MRGVSVRFDAKRAPNKKLAENESGFSSQLSQYSRGAPAEAQKDDVNLRYYFYSYDLAKSNDSDASGSSRAGGYAPTSGTNSGIQPDANGGEELGDKSKLAPEIRRARRIETRDIVANRQAGEPASPEQSLSQSVGGRASGIQAGAEATNQPTSPRTLNGKAEAKADNQNNNWKVLFVFTSEDKPAPGAAPDNRPK